MRVNLACVAVTLLAIGACHTGAEVQPEQPAALPAPPPPTGAFLPAGSMLEVELNQTIDADRNRVGDRFTATVKEPLIAQNGEVVVPEGAVVSGVITGLKPSRHVGDQGAVRIHFDRLSMMGRTYPFSANVVDTDIEFEGEERRRIERGALIGGAAGAGLGAIIGGDLADILIGGVLGAGAGTIISLGIGDIEDKLPAGTDMTLQTTQTVTLR